MPKTTKEGPPLPPPPSHINVLYLLWYAHLDDFWLWNRRDTTAEIGATNVSAVERLDNHPNNVYAFSSLSHWKLLERTLPQEKLNRLKEKVNEGQIVLGAWENEPDGLSAFPESYMRQGLLGQRKVHQLTGSYSDFVIINDTFGVANMANVWEQQKVKMVFGSRPGYHETSELYPIFTFKNGPASVRYYHAGFEYCSPGDHITRHLLCAASRGDKQRGISVAWGGVGDHGGGPTEVIMQEVEELPQQEPNPLGNIQILSLPPREFDGLVDQALEKTQTTLPEINQPLEYHADGVESTGMAVKQLDRKAGQNLILAEMTAELARRFSRFHYPQSLLTMGWEKLISSEFHDWGTAAPSVVQRDIIPALQMANNIGTTVSDEALTALAWNINTGEAKKDEYPFVVFNRHAHPVTGPVEMEVSSRVIEGHRLINSQGEEVDFQVIRSEVESGGRSRVLVVPTLPGVAYETFRFIPGTPRSQEILTADDTHMENTRFSVDINPQTGCVSRLWDKTYHVEVLPNQFNGRAQLPACEREAGRPLTVDDPYDSWGHFALVWNGEKEPLHPVSVRQIEHGSLRTTVEATYVKNGSKMTQCFSLYRDLPGLHVKLHGHWHEARKALQVTVPANIVLPEITFDTIFGNTQHAAYEQQEPTQTWISMGGRSDTEVPYSVNVLLNGINSVGPLVDSDLCGRGKQFVMMILRNPVAAHHLPRVLDANNSYHYTDEGPFEASYVILPEGQFWDENAIPQQAAAFNAPLEALPFTFNQGELPPAHSFMSIDKSDQVMLTAMKHAEDGGGTVIHLFESLGIPCETDIEIFGRSHHLSFTANGIRCLFIPDDPHAEIIGTDAIESNVPVTA